MRCSGKVCHMTHFLPGPGGPESVAIATDSVAGTDLTFLIGRFEGAGVERPATDMQVLANR